MISQIKAVSYHKTRGCDKFKELIASPFKLGQLDGNGRLFDGWRIKDMGNYYKCSYYDGNEIEFYPNYYIVKTKHGQCKLPLPNSIDIFVQDMERLGVDLYWSDDTVIEYSPRNMLAKDQIHKYYFDLLTRMGKAYEIIPLEK